MGRRNELLSLTDMGHFMWCEIHEGENGQSRGAIPCRSKCPQYEAYEDWCLPVLLEDRLKERFDVFYVLFFIAMFGPHCLSDLIVAVISVFPLTRP